MHVIATAGHVDHGKSTLVTSLTGTDPDRLAEEKARGLTIDLGLGDELYMSITGLVTTLLVWAVPNLTDAEPPAGS